MTDYYIYQNEEGLAVRTETDLSLFDEAPQPKRPAMAWVFIKLQSRDENGWCLEHEGDLLFQLQSDLNTVLKDKLNALNSGIRMQDGWLELFYYLPSAKKFDNIVRELFTGYKGYAYETGSSRDENWQHFINDIYPSPLMEQQITSRHIISELEEEGDDLECEREVEHYIFAQTPGQRDRLVEILAKQGFDFKENVETDSDFAHGAIVIKVHDVTEATLMKETTVLFEAVNEENGIYEGWSTVLTDV